MLVSRSLLQKSPTKIGFYGKRDLRKSFSDKENARVSFLCVTWWGNVCDMCVCVCGCVDVCVCERDSFICVTWRGNVCDMCVCVRGCVCVCVSVTRSHSWYDASIRVWCELYIHVTNSLWANYVSRTHYESTTYHELFMWCELYIPVLRMWRRKEKARVCVCDVIHLHQRLTNVLWVKHVSRSLYEFITYYELSMSWLHVTNFLWANCVSRTY